MKEYFKLALKSIKNNKVRSFLTMIGIIIGIASVIMIMSVGNGVKSSLLREMNSLFGGQIMFYALDEDFFFEPIFNDEDIQAIKDKVENVKGVTISSAIGGEVEGKRKIYTGYFEMCNPDFDYTKSNKLVKGRYFTWDEYYEGEMVCVIQEQSALNLFGSVNVVGEYVDVMLFNRTYPLRIVGVRGKSESAMMDLLYVWDEVELEVPVTCVNNMLGGDYFANYETLNVIAESPEDSMQVAQDTLRLLEGRKDVRGEDIIQVEEFSSATDEISMIINFVTLFISFVAAVSLLVGGIGVMNIMLVSVTERTREIGIRKALGATTGSIMLQFLAESAMITLIGGIVGLVIGWIGGLVVCSIITSVSGMNMVAYISIPMILLICGFSSVIGIFFGIYPARKAAKLSPIEALRHE